MSKKWVPIGAAMSAAAVAAVLLAAAPGHAGAASTANGSATTGAATTSTSAANATPTAATPAAPVVSAATLKEMATSAANLVSPAIVDIVAANSTTGAAGTGIVLTSTGEVLTNNHVIAGFTQITATDIGTGRTYQAKVVGTDAADDIAVLKLVDASGLPVAKLDRKTPGINSTVIAVGNANGAGGAPKWASGSVADLSVSVTATNEAGQSPESLTGMLKTTTPIVPGYSGGPLVNTAGEVVGMDTSGQFTSLSKPAVAAYAIPISEALTIAHKIEAAA